jgi:hypothetical protein
VNDTLFKLVDVIQRSTEFVDKGWGYFSTVTLATVALMYGSDRVRKNRELRLIVALVYLVFAIGNSVAIARAQGAATRWIMLFNDELAKVTPPLPIAPMIPFPVWQLVLLHAAISLAVIVMILLANKVRISPS